ncbi:MAG: hypothetical protein ABL956_06920 [Hyphomonadaceae bacterium]
MRMRILAGVAVLAVAGAIAGSALAYRVGDTVKVATAADDFRLVDHTGLAQSLRRLNDVDAVVVVSQVNGDAGSRKAGKALEALQAAYPKTKFMMLNSTLGVTRAQIAAEANSQGYSFPVLHDDLQLAGEQLGITTAGEAFVLQPKTLKVLYHGAADGVGAALANLKAGKPIAMTDVKFTGTPIAFPERQRAAEHAKISYESDVAPILQAKCVACHQEGGIGPFAMKDYATVKGWAPMIREAIRTDTMPPWHADPTVGKFKHDASLSNNQIKTIVHWIEAGAPRSGGADPLAVAATTAPEWPKGQPDLVVDIPGYTIPASGVVEYQYPTTVNPTTESHWVRSTSFIPGDRRGVHHILMGNIAEKPLEGPASASQWINSYGEFAVGGGDWNVPEGWGVELPAGGNLGFQMHYTPYGKESLDVSKVGLYFYPKDKAPTKIMRHAVVTDNFIELPANADFHKEIAYLQFPKNATLFSMMMHAHVRGQAAKVDLVEPNGKTTTILNVPRYDFNWQRYYDFAEPIKVAAGSKIVATWWYDNSTRNGANPNPKEKVIWGDQSWEEMHYSSMFYQWDDEKVGAEADATDALKASGAIGALDDNLDGKVQLTELRGRVYDAMQPKFAEFDADKDGALDATEIKAAKPVFAELRKYAPNRAPTAAQ